MPSPTQQFFNELTELSFADESYKQRFIEELHDHIEDAIHDADVRGVDDASAEHAAIEKLGSPKKLQKNFNRMLNPNRFRIVLLIVLQFVLTLLLSFVALIPLGAVSGIITRVYQFIILDYSGDQLSDLRTAIPYVVISLSFFVLFQITIFQSALSDLLAVKMQRSRFWLTYLGMVCLPVAIVLLFYFFSQLIGTPHELWRDQIHMISKITWVEYGISSYLLFSFLTFSFVYAAISVLLQLSGSSIWSWLVNRLPNRLRRIINHWTRERHFMNYATAPNIFGSIALLYLITWIVISFSPTLQLELTNSVFAFNGIEPRLWFMVFTIPITLLSLLQTVLISMVFTAISPITGIWLIGMWYALVLLGCLAVIALRLRGETKRFSQAVWFATCIAVICIMVLTNRFPSDSWQQEHTTAHWQRPVTHVSRKMEKKIFGPFYQIYNSTSLFSPIPNATTVVNFSDGEFQIQTSLGSAFTAPGAHPEDITLLHRYKKSTVSVTQNESLAPIPGELKGRVYCGEKPLNKKGDVFLDGAPSYLCESIKIDDTLIVTGGPTALLDIAISTDNSTALIVVRENGKSQVYRVNLK